MKSAKVKKIIAMVAFLAICLTTMAVGVTALVKSMQFSLGTKYAPLVKVKVEMQIGENYETIFNSANQGEVNYNASYIDSVTKDTIFLKQTQSLVENDIINLKFTSYDTTYKINIYINGSTTPNVLNKATNANTPFESDVIEVDISGVDEVLGLILLSLKFEPIEEYTISFDTQGGEACSPITFEKGQTPALPTPTLAGYEFKGWYLEESYVNKVTSTADITASTTLFAKWSVKTYEITYKDQGGAPFSGVLAQNSPTVHVYEKQTDLLSPSKDNYEFQGWFLNSDCTGSAITVLGATAFTDDITLYAKWQANSTAILLNNQSATTAGTAVIYFKDGDEKYYSNASCTTELTTITNPTKTGYVFEGYYSQINGAGVQYINSDGNIVASLMGLTHNTNLYASWVEVWDGITIATQFAGGNGSEATPYLISNGAQLAYLAQLVNSGATDTDNALYSTKHYQQTQNIYLNSAKIINGNGGALISGSYTSWTPIGNDSNSFKGTFDGSNKNISGIYINIDSACVGLFGEAQSATFKNINVLNSYIKGVVAGGIAGENYDGGSQFINCCNYSTIHGSTYGGTICGASFSDFYDNGVSTFTNFEVEILADEKVALDKGTGAVMCCTFGDETDLCWQETYKLPIKIAIDDGGKMTSLAGEFAGLKIKDARASIIEKLKEIGALYKQEEIIHAVSTHERCGTPMEINIKKQWFIDLLSHKKDFLEIGEKINWHPAFMKSRYNNWVENIDRDWCISRQRYFGVPIPVWYCEKCGEIIYAEESQLPCNPLISSPLHACPKCGSNDFIPEKDIFDTWQTSSITPLINAEWGENNKELLEKIYPFDVRPNGHDIIRTWDFYTIVKSFYHTNNLPWENLMISGFVMADKDNKISKSKGNSKFNPIDLFDEKSADITRYWASTGSLGRDIIFNDEEFKNGAKLVNKIWNASKFVLSFLENYQPKEVKLEKIDAWVIAKFNDMQKNFVKYLEKYEIGLALSELEKFFWNFCDNYIEIAKRRLYNPDVYGADKTESAQFASFSVLKEMLKLFAIYLPHVTEEIYQEYFVKHEKEKSIHLTQIKEMILKQELPENIISLGDDVVQIVGEVRRYKSENNLSLKEPIQKIVLNGYDNQIKDFETDIKAVGTIEQIEYQNSNEKNIFIPLR